MELRNNMHLFKYRQEVEQKSGEIEKLQEQLGGYNLITIEREKTEMERTKAGLNKEVNNNIPLYRYRDANHYGFAVFVPVLLLLLRRYGKQ